ncbi:MAG: response regulator transcription factor [Evtepia gabavorous]
MKTIAIIEDDQPIGDLLEEALSQAGYATLRAYSGTEAQYLLERAKPDLILLDLMLPGLTGEELLPCLGEIPVIVVSAKVGVDDKVNALLTGAADYVSKPFAMRELLARIAVQLQGPRGEEVPCLAFEDLMLDPAARQVTVGACRCISPGRNMRFCHLLLQNSGRVLSKSAILERISRDTPDCTEGSLKQHMSNLRKKLRSAGDGSTLRRYGGLDFSGRRNLDQILTKFLPISLTATW